MFFAINDPKENQKRSTKLSCAYTLNRQKNRDSYFDLLSLFAASHRIIWWSMEVSLVYCITIRNRCSCGKASWVTNKGGGGPWPCALVIGIEVIVVATSVINTKDIAAKDIAAEFPLVNFIKTDCHDPCDKNITGNYHLKYQISCKYLVISTDNYYYSFTYFFINLCLLFYSFSVNWLKHTDSDSFDGEKTAGISFIWAKLN